MAPVKAHQQKYASMMPSLKNTFVHLEGADEFDLDDCAWLMRRQASEPTPMKRQLSSAARENVVRAAMQLSSLDENESEEQVDENDKIKSVGAKGCIPDICISNVRTRRASLEIGAEMERQISSLSQSGFDRQISSLSAPGMDRQASCLSAAGFCRQTTEQVWPSYQVPMQQNCEAKDMILVDNQMQDFPQVQESICMESAPHEQAQNNTDTAEHSYDSCEAPLFMPMNPLMMSYAMNPLMWQAMCSTMMPGLGDNSDNSSSANTPTTLQSKGRRKATSLVTMAQEAQRKRQAEWEKQLEQQIKGCLGMSNSVENEKLDAPAAAPEEAPTTEIAPDAAPEDARKAMNFCGHCGGSLKGHFKFCQFCGKPVR
jgi:hypothetical protein